MLSYAVRRLSCGPTHFAMPIYVAVVTENSVKSPCLKISSASGNPLLIICWSSNTKLSDSKVSLNTTVVFSVLLRDQNPLFITYSRKCATLYKCICARNPTRVCDLSR